VYIVQYNNIGKYKQVYMYANSINTGPIRDGIIRVGKGHHTSPKFFGWQEGHKKNLKTCSQQTRHVHGTEFDTQHVNGTELTRHGIIYQGSTGIDTALARN